MSHEIDTTTGRAAAMYAGQPAWHGLGAVIEKATTSREAITLAGLDWTVEQWPIHATDPKSINAVTANNHVANVRTDTKSVLGIVGKRYKPFQNRGAFDFFDSIVGDNLAMYETAGSLKGGRRVWMLARIPKEYRAGPDDLIKPYVLLINSHDGSTALRMIATTVRVVCANTLNLALSNNTKGEGIAIRHQGSLNDRVRDARRKLGVVAARFDQFDEELHAMLDTEVTGKQLSTYFEGRLPSLELTSSDRQKNRRAQTLTAFNENFENTTNTLRGVRGTAWAAYNAVSEWADHQRGFRGKTNQTKAENRLNSVWFGSSHQLKQKAYDSALELAQSN